MISDKFKSHWLAVCWQRLLKISVFTCAWYSKSSATLSSSSDIQLWRAVMCWDLNEGKSLSAAAPVCYTHSGAQETAAANRRDKVCQVFKIKAFSFLIEGKCASDIFGFSKYKPLVLYRKLLYWPQVCVDFQNKSNGTVIIRISQDCPFFIKASAYWLMLWNVQYKPLSALCATQSFIESSVTLYELQSAGRCCIMCFLLLHRFYPNSCFTGITFSNDCTV